MRAHWLVVVVALFAVACAQSADRRGAPNGSGADAGSTFDVTPPGGDPQAACLAASESHSSIGCEYYAVMMDSIMPADNGCFVAFVANTSDKPAHLDVSFANLPIDMGAHVRHPRGAGKKLTYEDFDSASGIAPGDVAILFLAGPPDGSPIPDPSKGPDVSIPVPCPVTPARSSLTQLHGTGRTNAFHIRTDVPVIAYQMLPYGGGSAAVTGATLLLPTSAWDSNYVAVNAFTPAKESSMDIVAWEDGTTVTLLPVADVRSGGGLPGGKAGTPIDYHLDQGQVLQITQDKELTGSPVQADKPIALFAGQPCLTVPANVPYCDHAEQQIPPIRALGSEYAAVSHRPRTTTTEDPPWRLIGAVDGTQLTYDPPVSGAPTTINLGDVVEVHSRGRPFVVMSQDADHPFVFLSYMTGATTVGGGSLQGYGDADFVRVVPVPQYLKKYVFFTDPTYPETNLVVTRKRKDDGSFSDVTLDCAGVLDGWQSIGAGDVYEFTRIDLVRHDFEPQGGCDNGRHEMTSDGSFGLTVWGWGTAETKIFTGYVSYGYPAGENLAPLNTVVVPAKPR